VNYHEITEFFIAWLRKNPAQALRRLGVGFPARAGDQGLRRGLPARNGRRLQGDGEHMPDNGMQCVMFTHQDTGVWSDLIGIFWAAGLQVVAAWYIATETTSELKKGGYVQGTVIADAEEAPGR
jgi:putative DNA methylase